MASNTGSAKPAEFTPNGGVSVPNHDGRVWGLTTASTRGTSGGGSTANGKGAEFKC